MSGRPRGPLWDDIVSLVGRLGARVPVTPDVIYAKSALGVGRKRFNLALAKASRAGAVVRSGKRGAYRYAPAPGKAAAAPMPQGRISGAGIMGTRWALTNDGELILVGTSIEISRPAARALVKFVRELDGGEA